MGFNNFGAKAIVERLAKYYPKGQRSSPLGLNVGKSKQTVPEKAFEDYISAILCVASQADYITVNISSPNTHSLRLLHNKSFLEPLLEGIMKTRVSLYQSNAIQSLPCLLKISPDESYKNLETIIGLALEFDFDGIIATNTTIKRNSSPECVEEGGLSGEPLEKKFAGSDQVCCEGKWGKVTCHRGVGGILDPESAHRKLDAGASLLQLYSGFIFNGPLFPSKLVNSLNTRFFWP